MATASFKEKKIGFFQTTEICKKCNHAGQSQRFEIFSCRLPIGKTDDGETVYVEEDRYICPRCGNTQVVTKNLQDLREKFQ